MPNLIVCTRIYRWKEIYCERSDDIEKRNHSLITFLHVPCYGISWQNPKKTVLPGWVHGLQWEDRMIPYSMVKRLITMVVIGIEENDNKALIYVKGFKKHE